MRCSFYSLPLMAVLATGCDGNSAHTKDATDATVEPQPAAGRQPIDVGSLDPAWRSLVDRCLAEKRRDGQNIDSYQLVETKAVGAERYLYFEPRSAPNVASSEHFGCHFDADDRLHILYEG